MTAPYLSCHDVTLKVGQHVILHDANARLPLKGMTILRGHNGAGKTCFLRALMGLLPLQNGEILIDGRAPYTARHHIGYMPQKADETAPMLPAIDHVAACINGTRWGIPLYGTARARATALLREVGAVSLAQRPFGVLSGGERQRVALAQALTSSPRLLILDEPFAALDDTAQATMLQLFAHLHQSKGINLLITAHGVLEALPSSMPTREIHLKGGHLHV